MYACRAHSPINPHYGRLSLWVTTTLNPTLEADSTLSYGEGNGKAKANTRPGRVSSDSPRGQAVAGQVIKISAAFPLSE